MRRERRRRRRRERGAVCFSVRAKWIQHEGGEEDGNENGGGEREQERGRRRNRDVPQANNGCFVRSFVIHSPARKERSGMYSKERAVAAERERERERDIGEGAAAAVMVQLMHAMKVLKKKEGRETALSFTFSVPPALSLERK